MLCRLPTPLFNVLSHFGVYIIVKKMPIDPEHVALKFHRVTDVDLFSSGSSDDFCKYDSAMGSAQGYAAERFAPVKVRRLMMVPWCPSCHLLFMLIRSPQWQVSRSPMLSVISRGTVALFMVKRVY